MKYEFLKLLKDKAFLISLAACLIITVFMSVEKSQPDSQTKYVMEQYNYDTSEAYNDKIKEYRNIADSRSRIAKKAERLSNVNDEYLSKVNIKTYNLCKSPLEFKSVFNIQFFNRSDINSGYLSAVVILILFGIAVVRIFYADVNSELVMYIRSTYRGQNKVYNNKLIILLITAAVLAILKNVINFLPQIIYGSAGDWLNPIQCLELDSPYNISILTFFIIQILFTLSSYMFYGMIIVIVSVSSQKIVNSLIAVVITGGTWLLYHYIVAIRFGTPGIENKWYTFVSRYIGSPHALYYPRSYFNKLEFVRMGNIPFKPVTVYMICTIPLIIAMYFTGRYIYVKKGRR